MTNQQDRLYSAEAACPRGRTFDLAAAQDFVDAITSSDWWAEMYPSVRTVEVLKGRKSKSWAAAALGAQENPYGATITLAGGVGTEATLVHEMAHIAAEARWGASARGHGPYYFARTHLELVYRIRGPQDWQALRESYLRHEVCFDERLETFVRPLKS